MVIGETSSGARGLEYRKPDSLQLAYMTIGYLNIIGRETLREAGFRVMKLDSEEVTLEPLQESVRGYPAVEVAERPTPSI
jgi:hypothetical protein